MNRKGQTLIIFVILIPIFVLIAALVVDIGLMTYQYQHYRGIIDEGIKEYFAKDLEGLENILKLNGIENDEYSIVQKEELIEVDFETKIESVFGRIINLNEYEIKISRVGKKALGEVIIEKKGM